MPARLVALDEGSDIPLDRTMVVVGRHPQCDARLDSLRVSRHHCCMTLDNGEVVVRDLGSTNGIRINGQRVEIGRLKAGDELSIAHIRYRLDKEASNEKTIVGVPGPGEPLNTLGNAVGHVNGKSSQNIPAPRSLTPRPKSVTPRPDLEKPVLDALRDHLPPGMEKFKIQVIVNMDEDSAQGEGPDACPPDSSH